MPAQRILPKLRTTSIQKPVIATLLPKNRLDRVRNSTIAFVERELANGGGISISRQGNNLADRLEITSTQIAAKAEEKYGKLLSLSPEGELAFALTSSAKTKHIIAVHRIKEEFAEFKKIADSLKKGIRH